MIDRDSAQLFYLGEKIEEIRDDVKETNIELKEFRREVNDRNGYQEKEIIILQETVKSQGEKINWLYKGLGVAGIALIGVIVERVMNSL